MMSQIRTGSQPSLPPAVVGRDAFPTPAVEPHDTAMIGSEPFTRVTHFAPAGEGRFVRARKFATCLEQSVTLPDGAVFCEKADNRHAYVTRTSRDGDVVWRVPFDRNDTPHQLLGSCDASRVYLNSRKHLLALDLASGEVVGRFAYSENSLEPRVQTYEDGRVSTLNGNEVVRFDADLKELSREAYPWDVRRVQDLSGGGRVVVGPNDFFHLGHVLVQDANGREVFKSEQVRPESISITDRGSVRLLEWDESSVIRVLTVDPQSGTVAGHDTPQSPRAIVSQPDGSYIVYSHEYNDLGCAFMHYSADGGLLHAYVFDQVGRPRNLFLDADRGKGYAVMQTSQETQVFVMDLSAASQPDAVARLLYRASTNLVVPPVLSDGRLLVLGPHKVIEFGHDEKPLRTFSNLQGVSDAFDLGAPLQKNLVLGEEPFYDGEVPLRAWLCVAARNLAFDDNRAFADPKPLPGEVVFTADGCINFGRIEDGVQALREMRLSDDTVYQGMTMARLDPALLVDETPREIVTPEGGSCVEVSRDKLTWQVPGEKARERSGYEIVAALPVKAGDDTFVALADHARGTERGLGWFHPADGTLQLYDVGGPICGLFGGDREADAVYAVGRNGTVLMLEPPLDPGAHIETCVHVPRSLLAPVPDAEKVVVNDTTVTIGGLVLKRR